MTSGLVVGVAELRRRSGSRREVVVEAAVPGLGLESSTVVVPDGAAVKVDVMLESLPDSIVATGTIDAPWEGECRRCLREVRGLVRAEVREVFERRPIEGETYELADDHLDLEPMVRDAVLLALPLAPLCDESCPGPEPDEFPVATPDSDRPDPRWQALDQLRFD